MLGKFVYAIPQVIVFLTPSHQYQSPMCLECDTSINTIAKIANEFASEDLLTNNAFQVNPKNFTMPNYTLLLLVLTANRNS